MSGFAFDSNILVDALCGLPQAKEEIARSAGLGNVVNAGEVLGAEPPPCLSQLQVSIRAMEDCPGSPQ